MSTLTKTMPKTATVRELQRKYRELFDYVKRTQEPLYILTQNKPEIVVLSSDYYENMIKDNELTEEEAVLIAREGEKEYKAGKTKVLNSLADLD